MNEPSNPPDASRRAPEEREPGRRSLLLVLAGFAVLAIIVVGVSLAARTREGVVERFLGPLADGAPFNGVHIARVGPLRAGGVTLELADEQGGHWEIDLRAAAPTAPVPLAETTRLAIYLRGFRDTAPPAPAVAACAALSAALRERESVAEPLPLEPLPPESR